MNKDQEELFKIASGAAVMIGNAMCKLGQAIQAYVATEEGKKFVSSLFPCVRDCSYCGKRTTGGAVANIVASRANEVP
jgi:hypothetical protein